MSIPILDKGVLIEPVSATAASGYVLVDHPDGLAVTFTPAAALATAEVLRHAAIEAAAQRRQEEALQPGNG
jgi:hypothetical protein